METKGHLQILGLNQALSTCHRGTRCYDPKLSREAKTYKYNLRGKNSDFFLKETGIYSFRIQEEQRDMKSKYLAVSGRLRNEEINSWTSACTFLGHIEASQQVCCLLEIAWPKVPSECIYSCPIKKAPTFDLAFPKQVLKNSKGKKARALQTTSSAADCQKGQVDCRV